MAMLNRDFHDRDPVDVARELIGMHLVRRTSRGLCGGVIVDTEAYPAADAPASHSCRGRTRKIATMFRRAGLLDVQPIHGRHCLNAVTEPRGIASAGHIPSSGRSLPKSFPPINPRRSFRPVPPRGRPCFLRSVVPALTRRTCGPHRRLRHRPVFSTWQTQPAPWPRAAARCTR